jgi:hypothetical protein
VAFSSRYQKRPINLYYRGQPASGKNFAVDSTLQVIPREFYHKVTANSPRSLIYTTEEFKNRHVVMAEADSIPADGPAASVLRSIAEDAQVAYETVEKNPETGQFETRRIIKDGPTGFITTGVRPLEAQMASRVLECSISDDPSQTKLIIETEAREAESEIPGAEPDNTRFLAYQYWLHIRGEKRVTVPFAAALASKVKIGSVRMRRDFRQLLSAIKTLAFLTQKHRERTREGAIIASLEDYAKAKELLADTFDTMAADGITPAIRATVEAVKEGEEVSESDLVARLELSKSTIWYRVRGALRGRWLKNLEARRGLPARLVRGAPLPEAVSGLPTVDELRDALEHLAHSNGHSNGPQPTGGLRQTEEVFERSNGSEGTEEGGEAGEANGSEMEHFDL